MDYVLEIDSKVSAESIESKASSEWEESKQRNQDYGIDIRMPPVLGPAKKCCR